MTVRDSLQGINAYPLPEAALQSIITKRGLASGAEVTADTLRSAAFNLARADVLFWLSMAPDISQGGQSYSFTDQQRDDMRNEAMQLYGELEEDDAPRTIYGYKGSVL